MACENYIPGGRTSMQCKLTGEPIENDCGFTDFALMPEWCPYNKNCHEYCHYRKQCRYEKGANGINPDDCPMYWKIDDLMNDAMDAIMEERKSRQEDDDEW
jgi:hypothetical protein